VKLVTVTDRLDYNCADDETTSDVIHVVTGSMPAINHLHATLGKVKQGEEWSDILYICI
jgi:hypothetical protein